MDPSDYGKMAEQNEQVKSHDVHKSSTFTNGVRALLSIAVYGSIGVIAGHFLGRWGEDVERAGRGMSTQLGRLIGGLGLGGLAAYISLRGAAQEEQSRVDLIEKNAALEAQLKLLEENPQQPKVLVQPTQAEHAGMVESPALEKAI